jgi:hypothetical protein
VRTAEQTLLTAVTSWPGTSGACEWSQYQSAVVRMFGAATGIAYLPDLAEIGRRSEVALGAITDRAVLDAMMGLPVGIPIAAGCVTQRERHQLARAPRGVVDYDGGHLVRRAVAPVAVVLAVVRARRWPQGLVAAGRFAPFCARAVVLPVAPVDLDQASVQAAFWGVGLAVATGEAVRVLVEPEPYVRHRHSAGQWRFAEEIHRQITEATAVART